MSLTSKLSQKSKEVSTRSGPVWLGPEDASDSGGITYSLLCRYLVCKERFRIHVMEGLRPRQQFSHRMFYGNCWHVCEENFNQPKIQPKSWAEELHDYCNEERSKFPSSREEIDKWENMCKLQFPIYIKHWKKHPDMKSKTPLLSEQVFKVPYKLPSGRIVYLRGKWDSVDLIGKRKSSKVFIQEDKVKGDIDFQQIQRQLKFDLQTSMYIIALERFRDIGQDTALKSPQSIHDVESPFGGVRYNIIRRPLSGGKGTIVRHKATKNKSEETWDCYFDRLAVIITEDPEHYFQRWNVEIAPHEIENFRRICLDPILENLCYWYDCEVGCDPFVSAAHRAMPPHSWRHPFGVWNSLDEGGSSDLDWFLETGSQVGLERVTELFPELKG